MLLQQCAMHFVYDPMNAATLIFPHQLYKEHPALSKNSEIFLIEELLYFNHYNFHKCKLVLHRASMKHYESFLQKKGYEVTYIEATDKRSDIRKLVTYLAKQKKTTVQYCDVVDDWLSRRLDESCQKNQLQTIVFQTPNFLNSMAGVEEYFARKKTYFQTDFYIWQRKQRNILLEADGKPIGGKWTFDSENRQRFPKTEKVPGIHFPPENSYVKEARAYINTHWPDNYGNAGDFKYPTTFEEAEAWLDAFLETRLEKFGIYEDALVVNEKVLFHSVLTPMLNIGLLTPQQI